MAKKNAVLGAILGFFVFGIFYAGGMKKGGIAFIGLVVASYVIGNFIAVEASFIANLAGAYLGYSWVNEHNAAVGAGTTSQQS